MELPAVAEGIDPWPAIEQTYFTAMRNHREREDVAREANYRARRDPIRQQLIENYNAQAELSRKLRALQAGFVASQAKLDRLYEELEKEGKSMNAADAAKEAGWEESSTDVGSQKPGQPESESEPQRSAVYEQFGRARAAGMGGVVSPEPPRACGQVS
ncbi:hypothetical protein F5144DRAFT_123549 [Chaetomium tenue]|uniref:Uncharacterized protein n=1 Tax=Chaetomium tenue TaxID=1854479 RepID=A0ACB7PL45_9PEZI|nr:hypothetical protein F5144DRAFT_123549 [Chaetomium globosum]